MSCLENLPTVVLTCLLKHMQHEAKLSLRQTSKRMFEIVTALDETFNYWTFDPCMKEDLPQFVLESDKSFQIHIKDLDKKWESVRNDESDNDEDEEERNKEVQRVVKFISKHAQRIVSFKVSYGMEYDCNYLAQEVLDELAAVQPKWKNLRSFEIINTDVDEDYAENARDGGTDNGTFVENIANILEFCQNSLDRLVFVGLECKPNHDLRLQNLKTFVMDACTESDELIRSLAIGGNFSKLEKITITGPVDDVDISDFLSSDLSQLKKLAIEHVSISFEEPLKANFPNLTSIKLAMDTPAVGIEDFLILCLPTLEVIDLESGGDMEDDELDFPKLAAHTWNIKDLRLYMKNEFRCLYEYNDLDMFLNKCPSLEKLSLESEGGYGGGYSADSDDYDGMPQGYWESIAEIKNDLTTFSLKYLSCPIYFLKSFCPNSCDQISELHIEGRMWEYSFYNHDQLLLHDKKFPGLNSLTLENIPSGELKAVTSLLFDSAQVKECQGPFLGHKYERAFRSNGVERSRKTVEEADRNLLRPQARV